MYLYNIGREHAGLSSVRLRFARGILATSRDLPLHCYGNRGLPHPGNEMFRIRQT